MDKTIKISKLHQSKSDYNFWLTKSYIERIEAIEFLRYQFIEFKNVHNRLQRVCRIINKA